MKKLISFLLAIVSIVSISFIFTACDSSADNLTYTKLPNGTYAVTGITWFEEKVVIPEKYNGVAVTEIAVDAFRNNSFIKEVVLPASVKRIGEAAFQNASSLTKINLENVEHLGRTVFKDAFGTVPNVELTLNNLSTIGAKCFENALGLKTISINGTLSVIPLYTFASCSGLSTISFGSSVKRLENGAFTGCSSLESVSMTGVEYIGEECFNSCIVLSSLNLPSIEEIKERAFNNCTFISSVVCGENLKQLFPLAFYGCASLTTFTLTNPVASDWCYAMVNSNTTMATINNADSCQGSPYKHLLTDPVGFATRIRGGSFNRDSCFITKQWVEENGLSVGQSYTFTVFK